VVVVVDFFCCFLPTIIGVWEEVDIESDCVEEEEGCVLVLDELAPVP